MDSVFVTHNCCSTWNGCQLRIAELNFNTTVGVLVIRLGCRQASKMFIDYCWMWEDLARYERCCSGQVVGSGFCKKGNRASHGEQARKRHGFTASASGPISRFLS